jgi:hypothetical protein
MPARSERNGDRFLDSDWPTPEPMVRQSQLFLEPVLRRTMLAMPGIRFMPRHAFEGYVQDAEGVTVTVRSVETGATLALPADCWALADRLRRARAA